MLEHNIMMQYLFCVFSWCDSSTDLCVFFMEAVLSYMSKIVQKSNLNIIGTLQSDDYTVLFEGVWISFRAFEMCSTIPFEKHCTFVIWFARNVWATLANFLHPHLLCHSDCSKIRARLSNMLLCWKIYDSCMCSTGAFANFVRVTGSYPPQHT